MIELENASVRFGQAIALRTVSIGFSAAKTTALVGASGCGKSTLLRLVLGILSPSTGSVRVDGIEVNPSTVQSVRRKVGYVMQDGGLFPHLTAGQNVRLQATAFGREPGWVEQRVTDLLEVVRLENSHLARYPAELSGGQRSRVSLLRALMLDPPLLLMDEPLGALDPITRAELQDELRSLFRQLGKTVLFVTHDINEAAWLGDEMLLLKEGTVVQRGTPSDLLERPASEYVRAFVHAQRDRLIEAVR